MLEFEVEKTIHCAKDTKQYYAILKYNEDQWAESTELKACFQKICFQSFSEVINIF